ncbi:MAG: nucleoside-diphosphate kinase, partial [Actinomycetota bacterium]
MAIESTLLIVKPDGVRRGLIGEVLRRVEAKGLVIESMRQLTIDRTLAEQH